MAGILILSNGDWEISSGGFRALAEGVNRFIGDGKAAAAIKNEFDLAVDSELYFIDMSQNFSSEMMRLFFSALSAHVAEVQSMNKRNWPNPELFDGYRGRLLELHQLTRQLIE